jgi:hypothetical protein
MRAIAWMLNREGRRVHDQSPPIEKADAGTRLRAPLSKTPVPKAAELTCLALENALAC